MNDNFEKNENNQDIFFDEKFLEPNIKTTIVFNENNENNKTNKENTDKLSTRPTIFPKIHNFNDFNLEDLDNNKNITIKETRIKQKKFGRKKKNDKENRKHNKYCEDNIIKKIKSSSVSTLSSHINFKIKKIYNGNIGKGVLRKQFLKMNQNQIIDLKSDKNFINKTLKDIFSNDISTKYTSFKSDHNRILIEKLLNENDVNKRIIFEKLFSLTFLECIKHIRGTSYYDVLEGLESLDDICKKYEDDNDYIELFKYNFLNFELIIHKKKLRKK